jgi:hypothetical protein
MIWLTMCAVAAKIAIVALKVTQLTLSEHSCVVWCLNQVGNNRAKKKNCNAIGMYNHMGERNLEISIFLYLSSLMNSVRGTPNKT